MVSVKQLTGVELELMMILWKIEEGSVNDVLTKLSKERPLAYTSVSTILRILEQKEIIASRKEGRGHIYFPLFSKSEYESLTLHNLVTKVFEGEPVAAVRKLIDSSELSEGDLKALKKLLDEKRKEQ